MERTQFGILCILLSLGVSCALQCYECDGTKTKACNDETFNKNSIKTKTCRAAAGDDYKFFRCFKTRLYINDDYYYTRGCIEDSVALASIMCGAREEDDKLQWDCCNDKDFCNAAPYTRAVYFTPAAISCLGLIIMNMNVF